MNDLNDSGAAPSSRCRQRLGRVVRILAGVIVLLAVVLGGLELFARYGLGLGDPPVLYNHPTIEYLFQPAQDGYRFGNHYHYNAYSMRSDDFAMHKPDATQLRVLILGDSVINGGNLTDQDDLATSLLQSWLAKDTGRPVGVGNVSAGSWGPPNVLAYMEQFGWFDADAAVIVLNFEDMKDVPSYKLIVGHHPNFPANPPCSAFYEGVERYGSRYLPIPQRHSRMPVAATPVNSAPRFHDAKLALETLIEQAKQHHVKFAIVQYPARNEWQDAQAPAAFAMAQQVAKETGTPIYWLGPAFKKARGDVRVHWRLCDVRLLRIY